jgi:hypothetical protein
VTEQKTLAQSETGQGGKTLPERRFGSHDRQ